MLDFMEGGKLECLEENPWSKDEEPTTNSTHINYDSWPESNPGYIGGKRALSPL